MSRVGKKPIQIADKVEVKIDNNLVTVKGPKGELKQDIHPLVTVTIKDGVVDVSVKNESNKLERSLWGTTRQLIENMIIGVTEGYQKQLEINGVGYRTEISGKKLTLNVGYSHPVIFDVPEDIDITIEKNVITVTGNDKQRVGEISAQIRKIKKPEPYKGKGIKYMDEVIIRKAGKQAKSAA